MVLETGEEEALTLRAIATVLADLDDVLIPSPDTRARVALAVARLVAADVGDGEIHLAWNWRQPLAALVDTHRRMELLYKGWYGVNAFTRVGKATDRIAAIRKERRYHQQHVEAAEHRAGIRRLMQTLTEVYGTTLGWYSVLEPTTTPECREAHGKNFEATMPPAIGYPGMVHGRCKCTPGPPHAGGEMMS